MDRRYFNLKWIGGAMVLVATALGTYLLYIFVRRYVENDEEVTPQMVFLEHRNVAHKLRKEGNEMFDRKLFDEAIDRYDRALEICPLQYHEDKAKLHQNKAAALQNLGQLDNALIEANNALQFCPRYKTALIRRSKIYEQMGHSQEALFDAAAAVTFNSSNKLTTVQYMDDLIKKKASVQVKQELSGIPVLQSDQDIKNYFQAFPTDPLLNDISDQDLSGEKLELNCITLLKNEKFYESFQSVQIELLNNNCSDEISTRLYLLRGTFYLLSCREKLAQYDFNTVITSDHASSLVKTIAILRRSALLHVNPLYINEAFEQAVNLCPDCADVYYHRGLVYETFELRKEAVEDFRRALNLKPDYSLAAAHNILNQYMLSKKSRSVHFNEFSTLINRFPRCIELHQTFIEVLMKEHKITEAERVINDLRAHYPDSGIVMLLLAKINNSQNKISKAIEILMEGIENDPKQAELYRYLAVICTKKGNLQHAADLLQSAIIHAKTDNDMMEYAEMREGVLAQLNVSHTFDIPVQEVLKQMSREIFFLEDS